MIHQFGIESVLNSEDRYGRTISHFIASFGTTEALQYIVDCDSNIVNVWRSDQSIPMIHLSLLSGNLTITDFLVTKYDFDISIKDSYDLNAMMRGILCDQCGFSISRPQDLVLRSHIYGINVNESNNVGLTPLHYAVQTCSLQTVSLIVWLGGDISAKDYYGRTAYDFAILYGNKGMLPMLTPTGCCKIGRFNVWMNLLLYIRKLRYITGSRFQELRYWVATFGYLIPTYFFNYYDIKSSIWFIHLLLIGATCVALITGLLTVLRDPGFIKTNGKSYLKLMKYLCNQKLEPYNRCLTLSELTEERHYRLCYICKCLAPKKLETLLLLWPMLYRI
ncbi:hypothetical protein BLOT_005071 [Blomia tropicalis]|nr:hypothetical protein BLOT_005071 [Blomia tropicalis]